MWCSVFMSRSSKVGDARTYPNRFASTAAQLGFLPGVSHRQIES